MLKFYAFINTKNRDYSKSNGFNTVQFIAVCTSVVTFFNKKLIRYKAPEVSFNKKNYYETIY